MLARLVSVVLLIACIGGCKEEGPLFRVDFSETDKGVAIVDYEHRTPTSYRMSAGQRILEFASCSSKDKPDTMWGVESVPFDVKADDNYVVLIEMEGDIPGGDVRPGAVIAWLDEGGQPIKTQDALGKTVAFTSRLNMPVGRANHGKSLAYSVGIVPRGVAKGRISCKVDVPNLKKDRRVAFRRLEYYQYRRGGRSPIDDMDAPVLEMLTPSPTADCSSPLRFRINDASGVDWKETTVRIDGEVVALNRLRRTADVYEYVSEQPWQEDSVHRVEIDASDVKGNCGYDCAFVAFTARRPTHPKCTIRDDGMLLVDGNPVFPLGWARVRPCEGNDYSVEKGVLDMKANGMNIAHAYLVGGVGTAREQKLYDELIKACEKHNVMLNVEPADRKPHGPRYIPLARENLLRTFDCKVPVIWNIGDDTSMHFTPDELKYCHRLCKAIDPDALTASADVATGPYGQVPFAPYSDILFLESYPLLAEKPADNEMANAAMNLDNAWCGTHAANIPGRTVCVLPQAFKGWSMWKRFPTIDEVRCQAYLAIAGRSRGLLFYASCGNKSNFNVQPPAGAAVDLTNYGPLNLPKFKEEFFALTREISRLMPSLVLRDASEQPIVKVVSGPAKNVVGGDSVRCLLKEDGLLVCANSAHEAVTVEVRSPAGEVLTQQLPRNGSFVVRVFVR